MRRDLNASSLRADATAAGLTMLELMVALSLVALAATGLFGVARMTGRNVQITESRLEAQQGARRALERVIEELRWAEAVIPNAGCAPAGLCVDRVTVRVPAGNPYRRDEGYDVVFQHNLRQREIERRVGRGTNNLASAVERVELTYLDAAGEPAAAPEAVARIRIRLVVRPRDGAEADVTSEVAMRNRRIVRPPTPAPTPVWRPSPRGIGEPLPPDRIRPPRVPPGRPEPR
ncbi:MAG: PulJ/GspJ family protein [Armatimonadota bacterium]